MPRPARKQPSPSEPRLSIRELLSYRLHRVANAMSRSAAYRIRRDFEVTLGEWRTLALLGAESPMTVKGLASASGLDKAQISRVVTSLVDRGLIHRETVPEERRMVHLSLTAEGDALFRRLIEAAAVRNDEYLGCLSASEIEALDRILLKLDTMARGRIEEDAGDKRED